MSNQVVIRRILTYRGDTKWLQKTLEKSIHGTKFIDAECSISAVSIDEFPVQVGPSLMDLFQKELTDAQEYYYDDDSKHEAYIEGVETCIELFQIFLKEG